MAKPLGSVRGVLAVLPLFRDLSRRRHAAVGPQMEITGCEMRELFYSRAGDAPRKVGPRAGDPAGAMRSPLNALSKAHELGQTLGSSQVVPLRSGPRSPMAGSLAVFSSVIDAKRQVEVLKRG